MPTQKLLTIQEAAKFFKVSEKTLRRWEKKGILSPIRTSGGHRRYTHSQLSEFKKNRRRTTVDTFSVSETPILLSKSSKYLEGSNIELPDLLKKQKFEQNSIDNENIVKSFKTPIRVYRKEIIRISVFAFITAILIGASTLTPIKTLVDGYKTRFANVIGMEKTALSESLKKDQISPQVAQVLAASTFENLKFKVNVESEFSENSDFLADVDVAGVLNLSGNNLTASDDLVINSAGGGTSIGLGTPATIDQTDGDLFITDDLEVAGDIFGTDGTFSGALSVSGNADIGGNAIVTGDVSAGSLTLNAETITDFTGTGITISGGALTATIGTSIESSEITDGTIDEIDLNASNSPTNAYVLTYNSSTGGFTWAVDSTGGAGDITSVTAGSGLAGGATTGDATLDIGAGNGITVNADDITIDLTTATDALSSTTSSSSGLEALASGLTLLQGCSTGQVLKWNETSDVWECANDTGAAASVVNVENNDVAVGTNVDTIDFSTDFLVSASPLNEANVSIADDILNFSELSDALTLDAATTITNSLSGNLTIDLTSTGDFVIADAGTAFATFSDSGNLQLGSNGLDGTLTIYSEQGGSDFTTTFQPGTQTQNITYTLPPDDGGVNHVLTTDGSGALVWSSVSGVGGMNSFTVSGDTGSDQTISDSNTLEVAGGVGIDTAGAATDTINLTFDSTELNDLTWGDNSDASILWTFNQSTGTDPTLAFSNNTVTVTAATTSLSGDLSVLGGDITGASSDSLDLAELADATFTFIRNDAGVVTLTSADDDTNADLTLIAGGTGTLTIGDSGSITTITGSDTNIAIIDGSTVNIDGDGSPTADLVQIGSGDTSVTDGVDALQLSFAVSAASGNIIDITPSYADATAGGTSETYNIIDIDAFTATQNASGDTGLIRGLNIGNLTQTETAGTLTANAIKVGTGWDSILDYNGTTVINGSGQIVSSQLTGTLFSITGGATETIIQGDTITYGDTTTIGLTVAATDTVTADVNSNSLDYVHFEPTLDLDTATETNLGANNFTYDLDGAGVINVQDNGTTFFSFDDDSTIDITFPAAGTLGIDAAATDNTTTAGVIDLNVDTTTDGNIGLNLDYTVRDASGSLAGVYGQRINATIDSDAGQSHTAYGLYVNGTNNDASSTLTGLYVDAGTGAGTEYAAAFMNGNVGIGTATPNNPLDILKNFTTSDTNRITLDINSNLSGASGGSYFDSYGISFTGTNSITGGGGVELFGFNSNVSTGDDAARQLVYGNYNTLTTYSGGSDDEAYGYYTDSNSASTGGIQVGFLANLPDTDILTRTGLQVNLSSGGNNTSYGVNISDITAAGSGTETALRIGSGFDNEIFFEKGSNDLQLRVTAPTGATRTLTIPAISSDVDICHTGGNCAGVGGGITGSGTTNTLAKFTGSGTIGNASITDDGTTVTFSTDNAFTLAGSENIDVSNTSLSTDLLSLTASGLTTDGVDGISLAFTQADDADATDTNSALNIALTSSSDNADVLNAINIGNLTAGTATETALRIGSGFDNEIFFEKGSNDLQFRVTAPTGATRTVTIPALSADADFCFTTGNCAGAGGGITGSGTSGQVAYFTSSGAIASETSGFGWDATNNLFTIAGETTQTTQVIASITGSAQGLTSGGLLSASETATSATASFTGDIASISSNRDNDTGSQTLTDTGNLLDLSRTTTTNNASATTNVTGALANITNVVTATTGTINDSANLLSITQDADATGALIYGIANRTGNSNTLLFEQSSGGTDILSLQDDGDLAILGDLTITGNDITFGNSETISNSVNNVLAITSDSTTFSGDITVSGGDILGANSATLDIGENTSGAFTFSAASTGDYIFTIDSDTNITSTGGADGTDVISIPAGDILLTDGDLDLSGGDFNVTLDAADSVNITKGAASSSGAGLILSNTTAASDTSGSEGQDISLTVTEYADDGAADTHIGLDLLVTNNATDAGTDDIVYGLRLQDLAGTSGQSNNEYGIYQAGTSWDYGALFEDDVRVGATDYLTISSVGDLTFTDADGGASITGPSGGALGIIASNSQALNLTTTTAGNISLDPAGAGDITLVTDGASTSYLNISGLSSGSGNALCVDGSNNVVTCTVGSGGISGSGTAGQIAYFTASGVIASETAGFGWDASANVLTIDGTTHTGTAGVINLDTTSSTNGNIGFSNTYTSVDDDAADTLYAARTDITIQDDTTASDTVYGQYIGITQNDTTPATTYGLGIIAEDAGTSPVSTGILVENLQATDIDLTDAILVRATTNDSIVDGLDVSDNEITNAINVGANPITGTTWTAFATGGTLTLDASTDIQLDADGSDVILQDGGSEFGRFTNNGGALELNSAGSLILSDTTINLSGGTTTFQVSGTGEVTLGSNDFSPATSDSNALGTSSNMWSDLFLASGAVINFNSDVTLTHASDSLSIAGGDFNVGIIDGQTISFDGDGSPTSDIVQIGNGDTSATDGVDGLQITLTADDASGNLVDLSPTFTDNDAGNNAETWNVIDIDALTVTQNDSGGAITGLVRGLNIGNLTESATGDDAITSNAIKVGTGWDSILDYNGTTVINGSGQVVAGQITGTIFTITDGSTPQTIDRGDTLTFSDSSTINAATSATDTVTMNVIANSLDFAHFEPSLDVDTATDINLGANALTIDLDDSGDFSIRDVTTDIATFADSGAITFDPTDGQAFLTNLGAGSYVQIAATAAPTNHLLSVTNSGFSTTSTNNNGIDILFDQGADGSADTNSALFVKPQTIANNSSDNLFGIQVNYLNQASAGNQYGVYINNSSGSTADLDAALYINNLDTAQLITDAILIESTGGGAITNGINFDDTDIVTEIVLQNDETIDNNSDGVILFSATNTRASNILEAYGTSIGLNNDASANNVINFGTGPGQATGSLYWGDDLVCDPSLTNCGWATLAGTQPTFDDVYQYSIDNTNLTMEIDNATGLTFNMTTTGDFTLQDNGNALANFGDDSVITFSPSNATTAAGRFVIDGTSTLFTTTSGLLDINATTITDTARGLDLTLANNDTDGAADTLYGMVINIDDNATTTAEDTTYGLYIDSLDNGTSDPDQVAEALIALDNSDATATDAVDNGIVFVAGAFTNGINFDAADFTTEIVLENAETIANQTNGTITLARVDTGAFTLSLSSDTSATISTTTGDLTLDAAGGNVLISDPINVGGGTAAAYNFFSTSLANNNIADDANDLFIQDELEVEGNARFDVDGSGVVSINGLDHTGATGALNIDVDNTTANGSTAGITFTFTNDDDTNASEIHKGASFVMVNNGVSADDNVLGIEIVNSSSSTADLDKALYINNLDTAQLITDAILIESTGGGAITNGINFNDTDIVTEIVLQNDETIDNNTDNQINLGLGSSGTLLLTSSTTATLTNSAGALGINAQATGLNLQADGSIDVNIAGGSGSTGCTVANSTGNLTCSGNITGAATGTMGYWSRASTTLSPATANDVVSVSSNDTSNAVLALTATGATANAMTLTADSVTTGLGLDMSLDALTTGTALAISSTATSFNGELLTLTKSGASGSTAFTSDIANIAYSQTFNGGVGLDSTGNVLDLSRAITLNNAGNTHTVSGAGVTISDSGTQTAGTLTWTGDTMRIAQNYTGANSSALNITTASTDSGSSNFALRVNDDGTFTDSTPFVVDEAGNVGIGTTTLPYKLNVTGTASGSTAYIGQFSGTLDSTTNNQMGYAFGPTVSPGSASVLNFYAIDVGANSSTANLSDAASLVGGGYFDPVYSGTGTLGILAGVVTQSDNTSSGTVSTNYGVWAKNPGSTGTIASNYGIRVAAMTRGTSDFGLAIGAADTNTLWVNDTGNSSTEAGGIVFGSSKDTNLYRSAANALATDDNFYADLAFSFGDTSPDGNAYNTIGTADAGGVNIGDASDLFITDALEVDGTAYFDGAIDSNGDVAIADTNISFDGASTTFTTTGAFTLTPGGAVLLGDGGDTMQINSSDWDISTTGDLTNIGSITMDGRLDTAAHNNNTGLNLPTNAGAPVGVTGTAEGDVVYDTTNNALYVYDGAAFAQIGGGGYSGWNLAGDTGTPEAISSGNTATFTGSTGIDTSVGATDTLTLTFDSTELNDLTFGDNSDASILWTFNQSGATDPTLTFANNALTIGSAATLTATDVTAFNCTDCIDFDDITDSTTLDASTAIGFGAGALNLTFTNNGSGNEIHNLTSTGDLVIQDNSQNLAVFGDDSIITLTPANVTTAAGRVVIDGASTDSTATAGLLDIDIDTITDTSKGLSLDYQVGDTAGNITGYGVKIDLTVDNDAGQSNTVYGEYIGITANDASSTTYGLGIIAEDAGAQVATVGLLVENLQATDIDLTDAILVRATTNDSIVDGLDVSDAELTNGLNLGGNFALFDGIRAFSPSTGQITIEDTSGNDFAYLKSSGTSGGILAIDISTSAPGTCTEGELYTNDTDGNIYYCTATDTWVDLTSGGSGSPGGSDTQVQYNDGGAFGGMSAFTFNDVTGEMTMTDDFTLTLAEAEDVSIAWSVSGSQSGQGEYISVTNSSSSGTQYGLSIDNLASSGTTESLLALTNTDADTVVTNGIYFAAGGAGTDFTNGINFDDANVDTEIVLENAETISNQSDGTIAFGVGGAAEVNLSATSLSPASAEGNALGTSSAEWDQLFLGDNAGVNLGLDDDWTILYDEATDDRLELTAAGATGFLVSTTTGTQTFSSQVATTATTSSAWVFTDNSLTSGTGGYFNSSSITTGNLLQLATATGADTLTSGNLLKISSDLANTTFTGNLAFIEWAPDGSTEIFNSTADLLHINAGQYANPGYLLNITDNGSAVFNVSQTQITSALPHQFTAAGDVSISYDLVFANQTASTIDSYGPLTIRSGESFENNNLTLDVYGTGAVVTDGKFSIGTQSSFTSTDTTPSVSGGNFFLTANGSGTVISNFDNGTAGQVIYVEIGDVNTDFDCTSNANFNCGTGEMDIINTGDVTTWIFDGTVWNLVGWMDTSEDYGTTTAGGADIAEYYPSSQALNSGEVVKVDPEHPEHVIRSSSAYESSVVGIVTTNPGIILGENTPGSHAIALAGRVPVKISNSSSNITPGDYITTSSEAGKATKATGNGRVIGQALESWTPNSGKSELIVFINNTWYEPVQLTNNGDVSGVKLAEDPNNPGYALLTDTEGNVVNKLSGLVSLLTENIKGGYAEFTQLVTGRVKTKEIAPLDNEKDVAITVGNQNQTGFGKLLIKNSQSEVVAEVDEAGNATFSGQLASDSFETNDATVSGELRADKIIANEIVGLDAKIATIAATSYSSMTREDIEALLRDVEADQQALSESQNWNINNATGSGQLNELALENLYVTGTAAFDSLSLTQSLTVGNDLVISSLTANNQSLTTIDSLSAPLSIQSSASQPLYIMAGKVAIDTSGNVQIAGDLAVGGSLDAKSLTLSADPEHLTGFGKLLSVTDSLGQEVAGITATGSATFASVETEKLLVSSDPNATSSATLAGLLYESNATAGTAKVPSGAREVTISNPNITDISLVFVTPTSSTTNILYIKEQSDGSIKVGFDVPTLTDVNFNWWIVGLSAATNN